MGDGFFKGNERIFLAVFVFLVASVGILYQTRGKVISAPSEGGATETSHLRTYVPAILDLNTASAEELETLPGIGPAKARAIVEYRSKSPFTSPDEVINVPGIGPKTYEKFKHRVTVSAPTTQKATPQTAEVSATKPTSERSERPKVAVDATQPNSPTEARKINVNTAGEEELQKLPGIGPAKAKAIVEYRKTKGPFRSVEELLEVKGIGPKTLEKLRPLITTE